MYLYTVPYFCLPRSCDVTADMMLMTDESFGTLRVVALFATANKDGDPIHVMSRCRPGK